MAPTLSDQKILSDQNSIRSLADLLQSRASEHPDRVVYRFIGAKAGEESILTYQALYQLADTWAHTIAQQTAGDDRVVILMEPSLDYLVAFWAIVLSGRIAVPAFPPKLAQLATSLPRIESILNDCEAALVLCHPPLLKQLGRLQRASSQFRDVAWLPLAVEHPESSEFFAQDAPLSSQQALLKPQLDDNAICFLQYTSGSTSEPKGVEVTHQNILHNSEAIFTALECQNSLVSWLPPFHDMGLIGNVIQTVYGAGTGTFMSPTTFLAKPITWLAAISRYRAAVSVSPNFGYDYCVQKIHPHHLTGLDLSHWRCALSGSEPVRADTLRAFEKKFSPVGFHGTAFHPCYGLAEATLIVTGGQPSTGFRALHWDALSQQSGQVHPGQVHPSSPEAATIESVACGLPAKGVTVTIVNPETGSRLANNTIGEIWVQSASVARGYWKKPELSRHIFGAHLPGDAAPYLRTGDLGFLDDTGELHIAGRLKDVMIVRGRNIYPNDIEQIALRALPNQHAKALAFGLDMDGTDEIIVLLEASRTDPEQAQTLVNSALQALTASELAISPLLIAAVPSSDIPLTSSGKLQRSHAKKQFDRLSMTFLALALNDSAIRQGHEPLAGSTASTGRALAADFPVMGQADARFTEWVRLARKSWREFGCYPRIDHCLMAKDTDLNDADAWVTALPAQGLAPKPHTRADLRSWLFETVARLMAREVTSLHDAQSFADLGFDSVSSVELASRLSEHFGIEVPATFAWEMSGLGAAVDDLYQRLHQSPGPTASGPQDAAQPSTAALAADGAIAVVGLACHFPGAETPTDFWQLLLAGMDAFCEAPTSRFGNSLALTGQNGQPITTFGAYLADITQFEPQFFGITGREAHKMDPQQRLFLQVAWNALEDAGIVPSQLSGTATGVFLGASQQEYWGLQASQHADLDIYACTGSSNAVAANRLSYFLNLRGPSMTIDTACSSALIGVHLACESLKRGESQLAIAGGVNLMLQPDLTVAFTQAEMLSPSGVCQTFSQNADGYVRGEGCGVVILKRLAEAQQDNDPIYAVITGSSCGHGGRANGLTAPNPQAQRALIQSALAQARCHPNAVEYIETHGTGTPLGDPLEVSALGAVYGADSSRPVCHLGSVKANIGHLEAAAGIAGLIKACLVAKHGLIPPQIHCEALSPKIAWDSLRLAVPKHPTPLSERACLAVSAFGFGGALCHMLLQRPPQRLTPPRLATPAPLESPAVFCLSARSEVSLSWRIANLRDYLRDQIHRLGSPGVDLGGIASTLWTGREHFPCRAAVTARTPEQLDAELTRLLAARDAGDSPQPLGNDAKVALLFTGQGTQYTAMGVDLYRHNAVFRTTVDRCEAQLQAAFGHNFTELVSETRLLCETRVLQPILYVLHCALADVWASTGLHSDMVLGHSLGEYAAMRSAGIVSLEEGLALVIARADSMALADTHFGMALCRGNLSNLAADMARISTQLVLAVHNSPECQVVSGPTDALDALAAQHPRAYHVKRLAVSGGFHHPNLLPIADSFRQRVTQPLGRCQGVDFISTLTGQSYASPIDSQYLVDQLLSPVRFDDAFMHAYAQGARVFIEIGPGQGLSLFCQQIAQHQGFNSAGLTVASLLEGSDECAHLAKALAQLWAALPATHLVPWPSAPVSSRISLPGYPFNTQSYWLPPSALAPSQSTPINTPTPGVTMAQSDIAQAIDLFKSQNDTLAQLLARHDEAGLVRRQLATPGDATILAADTRLAADMMLATPGASPRPDTASASQIIREMIGQIAGLPVADIHLDDRLTAGLGLDSLMRNELEARIAKIWPEAALSARRAAHEDPSIRELLSLISNEPSQAPGIEIGLNQHPAPADNTPTRQEALTQAEPCTPIVDFRDTEQYQNHLMRLDLIASVGDNPYGRIHEGFNGAYSGYLGKQRVNFASFNYCGLSNHSRVMSAAKHAIDTYGTSPSATPLLFGETPLHQDLEATIAHFLGTEASVVFASGHSTSVAVIGHIMNEDDLIIHDQLIHDCAIRGALLSGAQRRSYSHENWIELDNTLSKIRKYYKKVLIITEGIYSQDGDIGNLPEFIRIKKKHGCLLMVDEAHSIGVLGETGRGIGEFWGVNRQDVDIWMGTLSKGLGSCGGYIASTREFIKFLKYTTPLLIFSTGITPANAAAARESIKTLLDEPDRVKRLGEKSAWFLARAKALGLDTGPSEGTPIIPIIVGSWERAMILSNKLSHDGINVMPIGYPAVDKNRCRLRFFVNVDHEIADLNRALERLVHHMNAEILQTETTTANLEA